MDRKQRERIEFWLAIVRTVATAVAAGVVIWRLLGTPGPIP